MNHLRTTILIFILIITPLYGQDSMTFNYIEYNRGMSFSTTSDLRIIYQNHDYTFHNLHLQGKSFFPDNSIIPNAFLKHLIKLKLGDALKAFTEPYYGIRFFHFLKKNPKIGLGIEFTHFKVFLVDKEQRVRLTGKKNGSPIDQTIEVKDYIDLFNISHGVNHLSFTFVYRFMLLQTPRIRDGKLQPYVSLNAGPAIPHLELTTMENGKSDKKAYSYRFSFPNLGFSIGLGLRYRPFKHVGFYLEYKFSYSYLQRMRFDNGENGKVTMNFPAHHLLWGFSIII